MAYSDYKLGGRYEKMSIQASIIDSDVRIHRSNDKVDNIIITSRIEVYDTQQLLDKIKMFGKEPVDIILALFAYAYPQEFCCECKNKIRLCQSCADRAKYISQFTSFNEILLAYYMDKAHNSKWNFDKEKWD